MKTATLKSIELKDFRTHRDVKLEFTPGENTIELPNRKGKTTFFDSFSWVVFGKDSEQNSRFSVESNNVEKPKTKATLIFDVDGVEVVLTKEPGKWYYNAMEVKKNVFEELVSNIASIETLEFLANPMAFMNLHWETRRNLLTSMFCEKVSEDSEFSFLMKSMGISDIRKSKTQAKKIANDGLKRSGIIIETHEKTLSEMEYIDFSGLKKQLLEKTEELEGKSSFDWQEYYRSKQVVDGMQNEYNRMVSEYKDLEGKLVTINAATYEKSNGCSSCGAKITIEKWQSLKDDSLKKNTELLESKKPDILRINKSLKTLKEGLAALESVKPTETLTAVLDELKKGIAEINVQISKENDILQLKEKIKKEQQNLDGFTKEIMEIEAFMDRFNTFLSESYYKSINENFDGLFFDIENECRCTNAAGTDFKDFSLSETINAGVQIVSVLSKKVGLKFPLWIDNRESVTELYPVDTQIINLKVCQ